MFEVVVAKKNKKASHLRESFHGGWGYRQKIREKLKQPKLAMFGHTEKRKNLITK